MVNGLDIFAEWFRGYERNYIVIGGTACDLLLKDAGLDFRVTKDIDMVIIAETLDEEFGTRLWEFVKMADYEHRRTSTDIPEYYRFSHPKSAEYPVMIELFSSRPEGIKLSGDAVLTPMPIGDDISGLSAILLDKQYYEFIKTGIILQHGIPILDTAHLILLKAKAWLDLTKRKDNGEQIDSRSIRKHKNDIIRLSALMTGDDRLEIFDTLKADFQEFLSAVEDNEKLYRIAQIYGL